MLGLTKPMALIPALAFLCLSVVFGSCGAYAAPAGTSNVVGTVADSHGTPVSGATVTIQGESRTTTTTDARGAFRFADVPMGLYAVTVTKAGFSAFRNDEVAVIGGRDATVNVVLAQSSFSSLKVIGSVSTNVPGRARINTSTAAVSEVPNSVFADQGQVQVTKVLNEVPGIIAYSAGNNASQNTAPAPQIRGAMG